jgi:hypothetical protein
VDSIVTEQVLPERAKLLRKLIEVAALLQGWPYKNFHSFMAVMAALQSSAVARLKRTWLVIAGTHITIVCNCVISVC